MTQSLPDILAAISRELHHLAKLTSTLQDKLSPQHQRNCDVEAYQSLDALTQTLDCLAMYTTQVGSLLQCQCHVSVDTAASQICLGALSQRLRGDLNNQTLVVTQAVELF